MISSLLVLGGLSITTPVPLVVLTPTDTLFTVEQARRGELVFAESCAGCHGAQLEGGDGPRLVGSEFLARWSLPERTLDDLFGQIQVFMPKDVPESLPVEAYVDVVAYILEQNGYRAGGTPLTSSASELKKIRLTRPVPTSRGFPSRNRSNTIPSGP